MLFVTIGTLEIAEHVGHHNDIQSVLIRHPEVLALPYNLHFIVIVGNYISAFAEVSQEVLLHKVGGSSARVS